MCLKKVKMSRSAILSLPTALNLLQSIVASSIPPVRRSVSPFPVELCNGVDIEDASVPTLTSYFEAGNLTVSTKPSFQACM